MPHLVLCTDFQHRGEPTLEREALAPSCTIEAFRWSEQDRVPASSWARAAALLCYHEVQVDEALLDRMPACRVVVRAGVGYDNIDLAAAGRRGIAVCNTPDYGTMDVADHAIALTLCFLRGITTYNDLLFDDPVEGWRFDAAPTVRRLSTVSFGVVGLGRIGTAAALRAKALGMRVRFFDPYRPTGTELALGVERVAALEELLETSDVLSIHAPLTRETRGMIGADALARCRRGTILVNTARGGIVNLMALLAALEDGRIAAAGLDVLETEPLPADHPLMATWRAPGSPIRHRLVVTPHAAFYSPSSVVDLRRKSAVVVRRFLETGASIDCVNDGLIDPAARRARERR
jgi:phosphoglycerate dehydrogenase-like enzyme